MKEQDVEKKLKRALHQPCPTGREKHFEETIWLVREELVQKKKRGRFSFLRFLLMQTRYIGWKIWGIQGILLAIISYLLVSLQGEPAVCGKADILPVGSGFYDCLTIYLSFCPLSNAGN